MSESSKKAMEIATQVLVDRAPKMGGNFWTTQRLATAIDAYAAERVDEAMGIAYESGLAARTDKDIKQRSWAARTIRRLRRGEWELGRRLLSDSRDRLLEVLGVCETIRVDTAVKVAEAVAEERRRCLAWVRSTVWDEDGSIEETELGVESGDWPEGVNP
jgi:hypothetical protein